MNVLVTGGTGYLGQRHRPRARAAGPQPTVFARRATAAADLPGACLNGDVRDRPRRAGRRAWHGRGRSTPPRWSACGSRTRPTSIGSTSAGSRPSSTCAPHRQPAGSSSRHRSSPCRRPAQPGRSRRTIISARRCGRARWRGRPSARGVPLVTVTPGVIYGRASIRRATWSAGWSAITGGPAARHHRRRPDLVVLVRRRRGGCSRARAEQTASRATTTSPAARTRPQMRAFEIVAGADRPPLPRRIPGSVAQLRRGWPKKSRRTGGTTPRLTRGTVRILSHDWPLDSARSIQKLSYRITPFDKGINRLLAGT